MDTSRTARLFLAMNAAFSLVCGGLCLLFAGALADILFAAPADWQSLVLGLLGGGLILFASGLAVMATNRFVKKSEVTMIVAMDLGWILASVAVLVMFGSAFSANGTLVVSAVACVVGAFALGQYLGAQKIVPPASQALIRRMQGKVLLHVSRKVNVPSDVVWRVMTDHPGYADVAANLSRVDVVAGDGEGMQRRCFGPKGENWLETCDLYVEGQVYGFRVHTEAKDYPYPIAALQGRWSVEPKGAASIFAIDIEAVPKGSAVQRFLFSLVAKRQFKAVLVDLAEAWAARMEREALGHTGKRAS